MNIHDMAAKIVWLGHDGFRIEAEKTIYIDPYKIGSAAPADIILVTHEHYDHCSPEDVRRIQKPGTVIVTEKDSAEKLSGDIRIVAPGESITVGDVTISAVPAYNIGKDFHPKAKGWLGFIVDVAGIKIYHAGDTDFIPEMNDFAADIALLPVSGTYVMDARQAVEAALAIGPGMAMPMHFGTIVGSETDATDFSRALSGKIEVRIPLLGE